jgi:hypothetical protein
MSNIISTDNKSTADSDCSEYVSNNREFLFRVMAKGNAEAKGHALALLQRGGSASDIDQIQDLLEELKAEKRE